MTESSRHVIARIGKPHGVRGEVLLHLGSGGLSLLAPGAELRTERGLLTVAGLRRHHGKAIVQFAEVTDRDAAEELRGLALEAADEEVALEEGEVWPSDLIGCRVVLADGGVVGEVVDVLPWEAQDRLVLSVPGEEIELPFVEELVPSVDLDTKTITITPPDGLLPV